MHAYVVGIGSGRPDQLTAEAVAALEQVDVFLTADKGGAKHDLAALRQQLCRAVITHDRYRFLEVPDPPRNRSADDYGGAVRDWHQARIDVYAATIADALPAGGTVGFLVWGDPAFYDSTIRIVDGLRTVRVVDDHTVVPGISSLQLLAAAHRIVLNRIGAPVRLTTGRRLLEEYTAELGDVVVMLDGDLACAELASRHPDLHIYWGAQLGLPDQSLVAGRLDDRLDEIRRRRTEIRRDRGWVLDIYLLRRIRPENVPQELSAPAATLTT